MSAEAIREIVDDEVDKIERRLKKIYKREADELEKKAKAFFTQFEQRDLEMKKLVESGKMTKKEYTAWRQRQVMTGKRWEAFKGQAAESLASTRAQAVGIANGRMPFVYAISYNDVMKIGSKYVKGVSFNLVNEKTIAYLAEKDRNLLPYKYVKDKNGKVVKKLIRWNEKKITSEVMQGVLQGDGARDLAKRLRAVTSMDFDSSMRNARTSLGSAQSKGSFDGLHELEDYGLMVEKAWVTAHFGNIRKSHSAAEDEGSIPVDQEFGNGCQYPCDPDGAPEEVYNCRCCLETVVVGYNGKRFDEERL